MDSDVHHQTCICNAIHISECITTSSANKVHTLVIFTLPMLTSNTVSNHKSYFDMQNVFPNSLK